MFYVIVFTVIGIALVGIVLWRTGHRTATVDPAPHHHTGTESASLTHSGSAHARSASGVATSRSTTVASATDPGVRDGRERPPQPPMA
jgi:hypothetical protein